MGGIWWRIQGFDYSDRDDALGEDDSAKRRLSYASKDPEQAPIPLGDGEQMDICSEPKTPAKVAKGELGSDPIEESP